MEKSQTVSKYFPQATLKSEKKVVKSDRASTEILLKQNKNKINARHQRRYKGLV